MKTAFSHLIQESPLPILFCKDKLKLLILFANQFDYLFMKVSAAQNVYDAL